MSVGINFRHATIKDIVFVTKAIVEAEKSGTEFSFYQRTFDLTEDQLKKLFNSFLSEEMEGSEFFCDNFILAESGNEVLGGIAFWIEGSGSESSNFIKANLMSYHFGAETMKMAQKKFETLSSVDIPRSPGSLQVESVFVEETSRGKQIASKILQYGIDFYKAKYPDLRFAETFVVAENECSVKAFEKSGFKEVKRKLSSDPDITKVFPGTGRIKFVKNI